MSCSGCSVTVGIQPFLSPRPWALGIMGLSLPVGIVLEGERLLKYIFVLINNSFSF